MQTLCLFFKPTLAKAVFTFHWIAYLLLRVVLGRGGDWRWWLVALWPLAALYLWGCIAVAWSRRRTPARSWSGRRIALVLACLVAVDQLAKALVAARLAPGASVPIVEGWLALTHTPNIAGSMLLPASAKPALLLLVLFALPLAALIHRYYVETRRRSLWADLALLGVAAGCASWLIDIIARGYILDFVLIPRVVAFDFKDLYLSLAVCVLIEVLEVDPAALFRWRGWRVEWANARRVVSNLAAFVRSKRLFR